MNRAVSLVLIIIALALAVSGCQAKVVSAPGDSPELHTVTASGDGIALAAPDTATLVFGVSFTESKAKAALDKASGAIDTISSAAKKAGVAAEDIQTSNVNVYPEYSNPRQGENPKVVGYRASIDVRVKVRDIGNVGVVIEAASAAGATNIQGPTFTLDDDADATDDAIAQAVADARRRAATMAEAGGRKLGGVVSIRETAVEIPPIYWGASDKYALSAERADIAIEAGQLDITANVTVVFELR